MLAKLRKTSKLDIPEKLNYKFYFTKYLLDNYCSIEFIKEKYSITLNSQNNIYNNSARP